MTEPPVFECLLMDAFECLSMMEDASVDLVLTDPPYESLEKHRKRGTTTRLKHSKSSSNDWFPVIPNSVFPKLFQEFYRVLKPNRHLYLHCDTETKFVVQPMAVEAGFKFWNDIVWDKCTIGLGYHYRRKHESVLFFEKGKRNLNDLSIPDVLPVKRIAGKVRGGKPYPAEKPVELEEIFIKQSTQEGELVFDPFMGSGSAGVAAIRHGRRFKGCDVVEKACAITFRRLQAELSKE